jgi:dTDP-glucose pyrophosphorylase
MAGISTLAIELGYPYPSPLIEIDGLPLIQRVVENLQELGQDITFTAVLREEDCRKFHLDNTVQLLAGGRANIVPLQNETAGALCSVLMAIEHFNTEQPLIIANVDQLFDRGELSAMISKIAETSADAACPVFESVHPRWSYLRLVDGAVVEAVEKDPVSRNAIAGLYYFRSGSQFSEHAMRAILNGRQTDGRYFTSAVLNEYILSGLSVAAIPIPSGGYHSLFTAQRVADFERRIRNK